MDRARSQIDHQVHEAEDLYLLGNADQHTWVCWICGQMQMEAKAWDYARRLRETGEPFRVRPYFAATGGEHPCDGKLQQAIQQGRVRQILRANDPPVPVYNLLRVRERRDYVQTDIGGEEDGGADLPERPVHRPPAQQPAPGDRHNKEAGTIRPLCRQYVWFPHDRATQRLDTGGLADGGTYREVFDQLRYSGLDDHIATRHIFVGQILFARDFEIQMKNHIISVPLSDRAEWKRVAAEDGALVNKPHRYRQVKIDTTTWTDAARNALLHELNDSQDEARHAAERPCIFFLGHQDQTDRLLFRCDRKELVCSFLANL